MYMFQFALQHRQMHWFWHSYIALVLYLPFFFFCVRATMKKHVSRVSTMRGELKPLRRRLSCKLVSRRSSGLVYMTSPLRDSGRAKGGEGGWKGMRKVPALRSSTAPSRSTHTPVQNRRCSSRHSAPPCRDFSPPPGARKERKSVASDGVWLALMPPRQIFLMSPARLRMFSNTCVIARSPSVPSPGGFLC
jgi:hypothetical protein